MDMKHKTKKRGYLFVFEGPDGVGKTSLAKATVDVLLSNSIPCEYLTFPGRKEGTLGHHIYELHHNRAQLETNTLAPTALQALHIAAHIDAIENQIRPLLEAGISVVLDRYWWSTLVYGQVNSANMKTLTALVKGEIAHWGKLKPDQIFLIKRNMPIERTFNDKWKLLMESYERLFAEKGGDTSSMIVDNEGTVENTISTLIEIISQRISGSLTYNGKEEKKSQSANSTAINVRTLLTTFSPLAPARTTKVYDTYWRFAAERQAIFFRRFDMKEAPWTDDVILNSYKFTNAYRASDRVSQYLIRHVIYEGEQSVDELFFRIMLFKIFNKISTWKLFTKAFGEVRYADYKQDHYDAVVTDAMARGETVFSAAYIMPSGSSTFGEKKKHRNYLKLLEKMMQENVPLRIADVRRMRDAFEILLGYPTIGDFLAYQLVTDLNYSCLTNFSEMEFVMPGPGARSGIRKCFETTGGLSDADLIRRVTDIQDIEFEQRGIWFKSLWGRQLQLIDCQNLFCEVDKYSRIAHPEVKGMGNRAQIKQKFEVKDNPRIDYWYPPKWGINDRIGKGVVFDGV